MSEPRTRPRLPSSYVVITPLFLLEWRGWKKVFGFTYRANFSTWQIWKMTVFAAAVPQPIFESAIFWRCCYFGCKELRSSLMLQEQLVVGKQTPWGNNFIQETLRQKQQISRLNFKGHRYQFRYNGSKDEGAQGLCLIPSTLTQTCYS